MPLHLVPVPKSLDKPEGSVDAMVEMALACDTAADLLRGGGSEASGAVNAMNFHAPVASALRGNVRTHAGNAKSLAGSLASFSAQLIAGAELLQVKINRYEENQQAIRDANAHNDAVERERNPLIPGRTIFS